MDAARIRIAEPPPTHCSSCFAQHPQLRHVDFSAFYDGPVFQAKTEGGIRPVIDDLILCEDCVRAAAELIGFADVETEREQIQRLTYQLDDTKEQLRLALEASASISDGVDKLGQLTELVQPKKTKRKAAA